MEYLTIIISIYATYLYVKAFSVHKKSIKENCIIFSSSGIKPKIIFDLANSCLIKK